MGNTKSWSTFFPPTHDLFVTVHSGAGAMASLPPKLSPFSLVDGRKALIFSVSILLASLLISGLEVGSGEDGGDELFREILRDEAVSRINQLGKISDADGYLERTFLSPGSIRATDLIMSWMQDAGLKTWVDQMGNLHGRTNAINATAETLLIGSHLDTVVDAGKYDGSLGIVCAISALKVLKVKGKLEKLYRPVEVIAFSDEEGVRFQSTFLGSAAIAGILPPTTLQISDKSGITVQDVLRENSFDATDESLARVKYEPRSVWGYVEVHIEQGPVLETLGYPLGVVKGIAGQTRLKVEVSGAQGHAGTVPMLMRQDPMAAAAELVVTVESLCKYPNKFLAYDEHCGFFGKESLAGLVCTVGEISCWPSASNVIPGQVNFTVDIRAIDDEARELVVSEFSNQVYRKCEERMVNCTIEHKHNAEAAHCDSGLSLQLKHATSSALGKMLGDIHSDVPILMSGAGHDAMAMSHLTKVGMLFVRCRGGISHSPEESVLDDDVWAAGLALLHFFDQHAKFRAKAAMSMAVFFSLTAPTGISLGIALSSNYNENSSTAFIVEGIFDAASTGILIYMALIDLFAADFTNPKMQNNGRLQLGTYLALLLGRGLISIIAKWA